MTTAEPTPPQPPASLNRVTVVDFDMPFGSMIVFMLKWAIASVPALLILVVLGGITTALLSGLLAVGFMRVRPDVDSTRVRPNADVGRIRTLEEWHQKCDEWHPDPV